MEIVEISGVGKFIDVNDFYFWKFYEYQADKIGTNEPGSAKDK